MPDDTKDPVGQAITDAAPAALAKKARGEGGPMFLLAILAGAFIAFGAIGMLVVQGTPDPVGGATAILSGLVFSIGLSLVMLTGAELFTGDTMFVLPGATGKLSAVRIVRAWAIIWTGNLVGALAIAALFVAAGGTAAAEGFVGVAAVDLASAKLTKDAWAIIASGVLANLLVCLAVWTAMSATSIQAKVIAVTGPVTLFVAAGFEHSVANMSILPIGWMASVHDAEAVARAGLSGDAFGWLPVLRNLALSTVGNIVGGAIVALGFGLAHRKIGD